MKNMKEERNEHKRSTRSLMLLLCSFVFQCAFVGVAVVVVVALCY